MIFRHADGPIYLQKATTAFFVGGLAVWGIYGWQAVNARNAAREAAYQAERTAEGESWAAAARIACSGAHDFTLCTKALVEAKSAERDEKDADAYEPDRDPYP